MTPIIFAIGLFVTLPIALSVIGVMRYYRAKKLRECNARLARLRWNEFAKVVLPILKKGKQ